MSFSELMPWASWKDLKGGLALTASTPALPGNYCNHLRAVLLAGTIICTWYPAFSSFGAEGRITPSAPAGAAPGGVFIQNRGQWEDDDIRFAMNSGGVNVGLTDSGPRFQLFRPSNTTTGAATGWQRHEFRTVFPGAKAAVPSGESAAAQRFNFQRGQPEAWRSDVPAWKSVVWKQLYPGVDLRLTGRHGGVKSDFIVAPGADWRQVRVRYEGIERLELRTNGALAVIPAPGWPALVEGAPLVYQESAGQRTVLKSRYELVDERTLAFALEAIPNPALPLVLDPDFGWATYIGGAGYDACMAIARNEATGRIYVTGHTKSSGWVSGGFDTTYGANLTHDAFVSCLETNGSNVVWSTYLGGGGEDYGQALTLDSNGDVLVAGKTSTPNWVSGGYDASLVKSNGYFYDGFIAKFSPAGTHLWSSYVGGNGDEGIFGIAVDAANNIYVCGEVWPNAYYPPDWLFGGERTNFVGSASDAFLVKLTTSGAHVWSGLVGGAGGEIAYGVAVDSATNVIIVGETTYGLWANGGYDTNWGGSTDGFITKLDPAGTLLWSSYLTGGIYGESAYAVVIDTNQDIIVAGRNASVTGISSNSKIAVTRVSPSGTLLWENFYGGSDGDNVAHAVSLNSRSEILIAGQTTSMGWAFGGPDLAYGGGVWQGGPAEDGFVLKLNAAGEHLWSSYAGGGSRDIYYGIVANSAGRIYCVGLTYSAGLENEVALPGGAGVVAEYLDGPAFQGALRVTFTPAEALAAGVKWRRLGATNWLNSGDLETNLPTGNYTIEIKETIGWLSTSNVTFVLTNAVTNDFVFAIQAAGSDFTWAGYLGGTGADRAQGVAADRAGNVVVVGYTDSSGWVSGGHDSVYNVRDGFVAKFAADGAPFWSTYLGGAGQDYARGVAVDTNGNILVVGETPSSGWISGGYDTNWGGSSDAFVVKLSSAGMHLWSTYLGGSGADYGYAIAANDAGDVFVAGKMGTANWATNGYDATLGSNPDGFVARLDASGALLWSSYLGGTGTDTATGIALDAASNVYVAGESLSTNWVSGGYQTNKAGTASVNDAFLVKLAPDGSHLWSTFVGGTLAETCNGLAVLPTGEAMLVGQSASSGWIAGGYDTNWTSTRAYAAVISANAMPAWSTYIGPASSEANAVTVNPAGAIYLAGACSGNSTNWVFNAADATRNGGTSDAFLARLGADGSLHWSTFYGGSAIDHGLAVSSSTNGVVYLAGYTASTNLWVLGNGDATANGSEDAFVVRLLDRHQARSPIVIRQLAVAPEGDLQFLVPAAGWALESLAVESAGSLGDNSVWITETGVSIAPAGPGLWEIRLPQPATTRFFRVVGTP